MTKDKGITVEDLAKIIYKLEIKGYASMVGATNLAQIILDRLPQVVRKEERKIKVNKLYSATMFTLADYYGENYDRKDAYTLEEFMERIKKHLD